MKKIYVVIAVALLLPAMIFANGGKETSASSWKNTELTIMGIWAGDTASAASYREKFQEISDADNGIHLTQEMISDETQYYNKLRTRFATGEYADIFEDYGASRDYDYVKSGVLVNLKPYLDADPEWKDSFVSGVFDDWIYDDYPDAIYGIPHDFYVVGLYYNKAIFDEVGVSAPTTIEEFENCCDKLLAAGYIPMTLGEKDNYRAGHLLNNLVLKSYGKDFVTKLGNREIAYDSPEMMKLFQMIYDWNQKGYFGPNAINKDSNMEKSDFHARKTAMHFDGTWYLSAAKTSEILNDIHFVAFPTINPEYSGSWQGGNNGGLSVVNSGDQQKIDKAVEVIKQVCNSDFQKQQQILNGGGVYPIKFESDPSTVMPLSVEVSNAMATAKEFCTDIQNYDINTKMLDTVRAALQGLFVGKTPKQCAAEIMSVVNAE